MTIDQKHAAISFKFVALMAMLMSFVALSIDAMMPALGLMRKDLGVANPNDIQWVISSIFFGMAGGLIFFGPLSDSWGRKPAICIGIGIFLVGCLVSIFAQTFQVMLIGRLLQGAGAASSRVVTIAMIRDKFNGNQMAKVMSFIMIIFVLIPALAPSIGQGILYFTHWRAIFVFMLALGLWGGIWLAFGQEETLRKDKRVPFSMKNIWSGIVETARHKTTRGYALAAGLVFGAFIGYISSAQQVLQVQYQLGDKFALAFGLLALTIGVSSFANTKWVDRYGMETLCKRALTVLVVVSGAFLLIAYGYAGKPPLAYLLGYFALSFFCFGMLFGNFSTLAIAPLGHIAGIANSVISSFQTLISACLGGFIGYSYDGTVLPLVMGFFFLGICSLLLVTRVSKLTRV